MQERRQTSCAAHTAEAAAQLPHLQTRPDAQAVPPHGLVASGSRASSRYGHRRRTGSSSYLLLRSCGLDNLGSVAATEGSVRCTFGTRQTRHLIFRPEEHEVVHAEGP